VSQNRNATVSTSGGVIVFPALPERDSTPTLIMVDDGLQVCRRHDRRALVTVIA
jgi:hypothetical protein